MLELKETLPEAASECLSSISQALQIGGGVISKNKNKVAMKRPKDFSSVYIPKRVHKKQKGTPVDVAALIREAQEKRALLLQAKQELEGDIHKAVPVATSTDETSRKKNETTKRKKKKKKRSKMKIPFNF